jgi:hypothetical protein
VTAGQRRDHHGELVIIASNDRLTDFETLLTDPRTFVTETQ